jgi:hypothetical protein
MDQPMNVEETQVEAVETPEEEPHYGPPRGAVWFAGLMLAFYVVYYLLHWFEIFVLRAGV